MSEQEPQDSNEWEAFADKKYDEIKKTIKKIESKGTSQSVEQNVRDATKGFGDMLIALGGLVYGVGSEVADKATGEEMTAFQKDLANKADTARNAIADEMDKVARKLRSGKKGSEEKGAGSKPSDETSDVT